MKTLDTQQTQSQQTSSQSCSAKELFFVKTKKCPMSGCDEDETLAHILLTGVVETGDKM